MTRSGHCRQGSSRAGLRVRRTAAGQVRQRRLDPARGEVGAPLAHLLDRAERRVADLALLADDVVEDRGVVLAAVEDQAQRVVPAAPRRQPVGEQQPAGRDLAARAPPRPRGRPRAAATRRPRPRRRAGPSPACRSAGTAAPGRPWSRISSWLIARLRGRKELSSARNPSGSCAGRSCGEPRVDDPVHGGAVDGHAAHHALAPQPRPGRDPLGGLVVGVDPRLDPGVALERWPRPRRAPPRPAGRPATSAGPPRRRRWSRGRLGSVTGSG